MTPYVPKFNDLWEKKNAKFNRKCRCTCMPCGQVNNTQFYFPINPQYFHYFYRVITILHQTITHEAKLYSGIKKKINRDKLVPEKRFQVLRICR